MLNLWVMLRRSSGSRRRTARGASTGTAAAASILGVSFLEVLSGWVRLQPSRYTATALRPSFQASRYACSMSSTVAALGRFTVLEMAPERNGWVAPIIRRWPR